MEKLIVIVESNHYAGDYTIMQAVARYKRLTGKQPTEHARIFMLSQEGKIADEITYTVDDDGTFHVEKDVQCTRIQ